MKPLLSLFTTCILLTLTPGTYAKTIDREGNTTAFMRPQDIGTIQKLRTNFYIVDPEAATLMDGIATMFNNNYSNDVTVEDVPKMSNFAENLALKRNGQLLAIEKRLPLAITDTLFFSMYNLRIKDYRLEFIPTDITAPGMQAILQDKFLGTETLLSLTQNNSVNFSVNSNIASKANDRFRIVFRSETALPVIFTDIKAITATERNITVQWKVQAEINIKSYIVEKSTDGTNFHKIATVAATHNNSYSWMDNNTAITNYYRIIPVEQNGPAGYSAIARADIRKEQTVKIQKNNFVSGTLQLQFNKMPGGSYTVQLLTGTGQQLSQKTITFTGDTATIPVQLQSTAKGIYIVKIIFPDGNSTTEKIQHL